MSLNTYLYFDGSCREAFEFYRSAFGGDFAIVMTYADAPADMSVPDDEKDRVMHVSLPIGSSVLMGSDTCSSMGGPPNAGDNFAVSITGESREHCDQMFAQAVGRRPDQDAHGRHVLGRLFRHVDRSLRHQLDDQLRAAARVNRAALRSTSDSIAKGRGAHSNSLMDSRSEPLSGTNSDKTCELRVRPT